MTGARSRAAKLFDTAAIACMFAAAFFLAASWLLAGDVLSAFCLGVSFATLSASVLLLSYAHHVRAGARRNPRENQDG